MRLVAPVFAALALGLAEAMSAAGGSATPFLRVHKEAPAWSPDGRKIALVAVRGGNAPTQIEVVNSDGSGLRILRLPRYVSAYSPAWSPDGRRIVFTCDRDLCIMNADGSGLLLLPNSSSEDRYFPAWSPDGKRIAFAALGVGIFAVDADGRRRRRLTPRGVPGEEPSWAPNAHAIVFTCRKGICAMRLDTSKTRVLARAPSGATESNPAWSPDGRKIAFTQTPASSPSAIYVMNPDGSEQWRLTPKTIYARDPTWSPDSSRIAFTGYHSGAPESIYVMNADGSDQHRLVP